VTAMSHALGITVVGEGIETSHQLDTPPGWTATKVRGSSSLAHCCRRQSSLSWAPVSEAVDCCYTKGDGPAASWNHR
jgi:hypothetical protein